MRRLGLLAAALVLASCGSTVAGPSLSPIPARIPSATAPAFPATTAPACATAGQAGPAKQASIELAKGGTIVIALRADKAPGTVANFAKNARQCRYDGLTFHRVVPSFVVQGGDPLGTGSGGGDQPTELNDLPFTKGAVGIARAGDIKISNAMQFFIMIGDSANLNGQYTNFGRVTAGQDIADAVRIGDRIRTIRIE